MRYAVGVADEKECCCVECAEKLETSVEAKTLKVHHGMARRGEGNDFYCPSCPIHAAMLPLEQVREMLAEVRRKGDALVGDVHSFPEESHYQGQRYALKRVLKEV